MWVNRSEWSINSLPDLICYVFIARTRKGPVFKERKNLAIQCCLQLLILPDHDSSCQRTSPRGHLALPWLFFPIFVCFLCFSSLSTDICPESIWIINAQWAKTWNGKLMLQDNHQNESHQRQTWHISSPKARLWLCFLIIVTIKIQPCCLTLLPSNSERPALLLKFLTLMSLSFTSGYWCSPGIHREQMYTWRCSLVKVPVMKLQLAGHIR